MVVESTEVLCICLKRFAYPCRYVDLIPRFGRPVSQLNMATNLLVSYIHNEFGSLLVNLDHAWLSRQPIQVFADAVHAKGAALDSCWGFVDGTVRPICRPTENQRAVYNRHKRVHAFKFQLVVTPNGLIANLFGPVEGRRHDSAMLVLITSTSEEITIPNLEHIFTMHGLPKGVKSDNGLPFPGTQFYRFMKEVGAKHTTSSPYWPQGNAEVERFMQPLEKAIQTAHLEGKEWKRSIYKYLLNYRATPHATTGKSPANVLFNREITTKFPQLVSNNVSVYLKDRDTQAKEQMKSYADRKCRATESDLVEGDIVLVKKSNITKLSARYNPKPYKIVKRKGNRVTVVRNGQYVTQNVSFFKKFHGSFDGDNDENDDMNQYDDYINCPGINELPGAEGNDYRKRMKVKKPHSLAQVS